MPEYTASGYSSNTGTIPWAGQVPYGETAGAINRFMNSQALNAYKANLPGYANAVGQRSENTQQMLEGQLPQDVIGQIGQQAAERGIGGGNPGSPNANAAYLRALGLNSLDMMGQGSQQLSQSIADAPIPELFNPASLWVPTVLGQQEAEAARSQLRSSQPSTQNLSSASDVRFGGFGSTIGVPHGIGALAAQGRYSFL